MEDQFEELQAFRSSLYRKGIIVDFVKSVSEAINKLRSNTFTAVIFDIKVLPGNTPEWEKYDGEQQVKNPNHDSYLGLELLRALFSPKQAKVRLNPPIQLSPKRVIVFSVVYDKTEEIVKMGIPADQIIYKANSELNTLPDLIEKIERECEG